jgi:hypothetical protein
MLASRQKAALKLAPAREKDWPAVEQAFRERIARREAPFV